MPAFDSQHHRLPQVWVWTLLWNGTRGKDKFPQGFLYIINLLLSSSQVSSSLTGTTPSSFLRCVHPWDLSSAHRTSSAWRLPRWWTQNPSWLSQSRSRLVRMFCWAGRGGQWWSSCLLRMVLEKVGKGQANFDLIPELDHNHSYYEPTIFLFDFISLISPY